MQPILAFIFIIIVILLVAVVYFSQPSKQGEEATPQPKETILQIQRSVPVKNQTFLRSVKPAQELKPAISIDTFIVSGPKEGEIINETNEVVFEFEAKLSPEDTKGQVTFETKIEGFDQDWLPTYSKKREVQLPGPKEYNFLVRAKIGEAIDQTPAKRNFKINISPYFGKVKISRVQAKTSYYPSLITLSTGLEKEEKINISNWRIKGNKGEIIIPQGIEVYFLQSSINRKDIFVGQYDVVYLSSDSSPLGTDLNFRPNKCFGYFLNSHDFLPSISRRCPQPELKEISHFSEYCQEFILNLGRCEIPDYSNNLRISFDPECQSYLNENFNYTGCFKNYSRDKDFLEHYWYIYLNRDVVSKLHDTLYLLDKDRLLVDRKSVV
jgi:hypothetical protein